MKLIIEILFQIILSLMKGIFDLFAILIGGNGFLQGRKKYNARFLGFWQRLKHLNKFHKGLAFSKFRIAEKQSLTHAIIVAKSGAGKTTHATIPSALQVKNSIFVIDPDGGVYQKTSGYQSSIGILPQTLDLKNPELSSFYNPIHHCKSATDLKELADLLIKIAYPNSDASASFWNSGGSNILWICLSLLKCEDESLQNMTNLRRFVQNFRLLESKIVEHGSEDLFSDFLMYKSAEPKVQSSWVSTANAALQMFSDEGVSFVTSKNTIDFDAMCNGKSSLYLIIPESRSTFYSPLISILVHQFFRHVQHSKPKKPIYFIADEAGNFFIPELPKLATVLRRSNIILLMLFQSFSQAEQLYSRNGAETLWNGAAGTKLIFSPMEYDMSVRLSNSFGKVSLSLNPDQPHHHSDRELISVQELMQTDKCVVLINNLQPYLMKLVPYYRIKKLRKRASIPPYKRPISEVKPPEVLSFNNAHQSL